MLPAKVRGNCFKIGGFPRIEVSWQITGVRQHRFAQAYALVVEPLKSRRERGYFIHPELYGAPGGQGYSVGSPPAAQCLSFARHKKSRWL
jgi:hypothetical protein